MTQETILSHLTEDQQERFRERLLAMQAQIDGLLAQTAADSRPVDLELPIGRLTRIDAVQIQAMAQMNRRQLDIQRQQVEVALASFAAGTYGACRACRGPIALGLEVLPESPFCIECQERFEQEG